MSGLKGVKKKLDFKAAYVYCISALCDANGCGVSGWKGGREEGVQAGGRRLAGKEGLSGLRHR